MKNSLFQKKPRQILAVLLFVPALMLAQSSSENYVKVDKYLYGGGYAKGFTNMQNHMLPGQYA